MPDYSCKVSVIIPIYNSEEYIRETLSSVCNQSLHDIEILCINDGSTDLSRDIVAEIATKDTRIRIVDELNAGQSVARNTGIVQARGEYIYFIDSDDIIETETLEACYVTSEKGHYDFVTFDSDVFNPAKIEIGNSLKYDRSHCLFQQVCYKGIDSFNLQLAKMAYTPSVPLLFIRTSFLKASKLSFKAGIIHEDQLFAALLYLKAERMAYIPAKLFHRRMHSDSTMTTAFSWKNAQSYLTVTDELIKAKQGMSSEASDTIDILLSQMLDSIVRWEAYKLPREERLSLAIICFRRYMRYVRSSSLFYLFVKSIIKKKAEPAPKPAKV
jgi:glycosyltransferase involved in cell wall biosynthesis